MKPWLPEKIHIYFIYCPQSYYCNSVEVRNELSYVNFYSHLINLHSFQIAYSVDEVKLMDVMSIAGRVKYIQLSRDVQGRSKGNGTVIFSSPIEAVQAIKMLNNQRVRCFSVFKLKYGHDLKDVCSNGRNKFSCHCWVSSIEMDTGNLSPVIHSNTRCRGALKTSHFSFSNKKKDLYHGTSCHEKLGL